MHQVHYRIADIEINRSPMDEKIIGLFRFDAEGRGKRAPTLVLMAEIASTLYVYEQLLDTICSSVEQARMLVSGVDSDPMARFEKLVERVNQSIAEFVSQEPTSISWSRVNLFLFELADGHVCFAGLGTMCNVFVQKQTDGTFRSFDLLGSLEQKPTTDPNKVFASLICGDFALGDLLFCGTSNFERLRSELKLSERLTTLPPVTAALEIRNDVEQRGIPDDFVGIVIAAVPPPASPPTVRTAPMEQEEENQSTRSIKKLREDERKTDAYLSPTISPIQPAATPDQDRPKRGARTLVSLLARAKSAFTSLRQRTDGMSLTSFRGMSAGHGSSLTPQRKRQLLIAGGAVLLILIAGIWWWRSRVFAAEQNTWNQSFDKAADSIHRAEADLLYQNDERARSLLKDARAILDALDEKTADRKKTRGDLFAQLATLESKARREVTVEQPTEFFSLAQGVPENSLVSLAFAGDRILTVDTSDKNLAEVRTDNREVRRFALPTSLAGTPNVIAGGKDQTFVLTDQNGLAVYEPKGPRFAVGTFDAPASSGTRAAVVYAGRLYTLDPQGNMIWRMNAGSSGASGATKYLKQTSTTFESAVDLAIDSSVYVAFENGQVKRFLSGAEESWSLPAIEPSLRNIAGFWTTADTDRVIVSDSANKRIIVYRKDGQLIQQILSPAFVHPTRVTGDAENKKIYVLDGNKVWQLEMP